MRRISTGQVGDTILGTLVTEANTVRPLASSDTLTLNGNTVATDVNFEITGGNSLRVYNGSNYVNVSPPSLSSNVNLTLPSADGSNGTVLSTDGSGNLSFEDVAVEITNQTADTATYYPLMSTGTSGSVTVISVSDSKLNFQPSSGTLTVTDLSATDADFSGNVGIGTTSPSEKLEVNGNAEVTGEIRENGNRVSTVGKSIAMTIAFG